MAFGTNNIVLDWLSLYIYRFGLYIRLLMHMDASIGNLSGTLKGEIFLCC